MGSNEAPERLLYSVPASAATLDVQRTTIYRLMAEGSLARVKIGRRTLVTAESLNAYVERLKDAAHAVA